MKLAAWMSYIELAIHNVEEDLLKKSNCDMASVFERNKTAYYLIEKMLYLQTNTVQIHEY